MLPKFTKYIILWLLYIIVHEYIEKMSRSSPSCPILSNQQRKSTTITIIVKASHTMDLFLCRKPITMAESTNYFGIIFMNYIEYIEPHIVIGKKYFIGKSAKPSLSLTVTKRDLHPQTRGVVEGINFYDKMDDEVPNF